MQADSSKIGTLEAGRAGRESHRFQGSRDLAGVHWPDAILKWRFARSPVQTKGWWKKFSLFRQLQFFFHSPLFRRETDGRWPGAWWCSAALPHTVALAGVGEVMRWSWWCFIEVLCTTTDMIDCSEVFVGVPWELLCSEQISECTERGKGRWDVLVAVLCTCSHCRVYYSTVPSRLQSDCIYYNAGFTGYYDRIDKNQNRNLKKTFKISLYPVHIGYTQWNRPFAQLLVWVRDGASGDGRSITCTWIAPRTARNGDKKSTSRPPETLKLHEGDWPTVTGCPVSNPGNNCANGLFGIIVCQYRLSWVSPWLGANARDWPGGGGGGGRLCASLAMIHWLQW